MSLLDTASLLLTPNAYKEGKLYSVIPSDGSGDFTFTRATTATRVNSDGLVELVPYNLLTYSEQFNNAYWNKNGGSISANSSTAPDGTATADRLTLAATTATHGLIDFGVGGVAASTYTVSFYVKKGTHRYITVGIYRNTLNNAGAGFDLDTNTITGTGATGTGYSASGATMTDVGNGWYRCSVVCVSGTTPMTGSGLFLRNTSYTIGAIQESWAASGTETINLWGAQLVEGTNALPYQKTETRLNTPRLDYSLGGCPNILLEPQRTNLALQSSSFDSATWAKTALTVTANNAISPSGVTDADKLAETAITSTHRLVQSSISIVNGTAYTLSLYVKSAERTRCALRFSDGVTTKGIGFDLTTQTTFALTSGELAPTSSSITSSGNGWYRITITSTSAGTSGNYQIHTMDSGTSTSFLGVLGDGIYIWGAQLEAGSYATSYIQTTTASVTRNAEVCSKTGITSLIGQTEGTIFFDGVINGCQNASASLINSERNTNTSFSIGYVKASKRIIAYVYDGSQKGNIQGGTFEIGERVKIAYTYKSGDFALYVNGVLIGTSTNAFTFPSTIDDIFIGDSVTYFNYQEAITNNATAIWKERLTNDQLAQLTTL